MKLNTNSCFLCCLILIIVMSLFLSCSCNNSIFEGLTGSPAEHAVYGISSEWYGGNCNDADIMISDNTIIKDISYNLSGTDILSNTATHSDGTPVSISFEHILETDLSLDTIHAYYIKINLIGSNKIHFLELDLSNTPTISFSCGPENISLGPGKISNAILHKIKLVESTPTSAPPTTRALNANSNANANANANSNTNTNLMANNNNVSVDVENQISPPTIAGTGQFIPPGSSYNPQTGLPFGPNIIQQPYATGYGTNSNNQGIFSSLTSGLNNTFGLNSNSSSETDNILNNLFSNQLNNYNSNSNSSMNTNTNTNPSNIFTTNDGRQGIANSQNTILGIPSSQIPAGHEDLYILKSQVVPPVCPACPPVYIDNKELGKECPPCPACARCPEPAFDCKKVPNYEMGPQNLYLPRPVLNDFSTFGT